MKPRQKRDYYERDRDRRDKERSRRRSTSRHYGRKEDRHRDRDHRDSGSGRRFNFENSSIRSTGHDDRGQRNYSPPPKVENSYRDSLLLQIKKENSSSLPFSDRKVLLRDDVDSCDSKANLKVEADSILSNTNSPVCRVPSSSFISGSKSSSRRVSYEDKESDDSDSDDELTSEILKEMLINTGLKMALLEEDIEKNKEDLDLLEYLMSKRRKLRKRLKNYKKKAKERIKRMKWIPLKPESICLLLENPDALNKKASFVIEEIFKKIEDTQDYFGKFGTLSACENLCVQNKVRIEFYNRSDTLTALKSKHPEGLLFYEDPFPEFKKSVPKKTNPLRASETPSSSSNVKNVKKEQERDLIDCDIKIETTKRQDDNKFTVLNDVDEALRMKIPKAEMKYAPDDFQPNNDNLYVLSAKINDGFFKYKDELQDYFIKFGDITLMRYEDGDMMKKSLIPDKNILIFFEAGHSLLLALNADHNEKIHVDVANECRTRIVYRKSPSPPSGRKRKIVSGSIGEEISKSRRYSREEFQTKDNNSEVKEDDNFHRQTGFRGRNETERFEPKEKDRGMVDEGVDGRDAAENARDVFYGDHDGVRRRSDESDQRSYRSRNFETERKHAKIPGGHSPSENWRCSRCQFNNYPSRMYDCYKCGENRPGNWKCGICKTVNFPDRLRCFVRDCQTLRRGNWICPDEECQRVNWSRSLQCFREGCFEGQPGSWFCSVLECGFLNFPDNDTCHLCKSRNSRVSDESFSKERRRSMELSAEREKQRQAIENINRESQRHPGTSEKYFEQPSENIWHKNKEKEDRRRARDNEETRKLQNKLLALVNNCSGDFIDLASDDDDQVQKKSNPTHKFLNNPNNANCEPLGQRPRKGVLGSNHDLGQSSSQSNQKEPESTSGVLNDEDIEKIQHGTLSEQDEILRQFNIVRIDRGSKPPSRNIVEVDLVDDSDDDLGKYSDGGSIIEADEVIRADEAPGAEKEIENNGAKSKSDQELIDDIVRGAGRNSDKKFDDDEDDDDVLILEAD